jgi:xylan 1,4-beta-xylosidase
MLDKNPQMGAKENRGPRQSIVWAWLRHFKAGHSAGTAAVPFAHGHYKEGPPGILLNKAAIVRLLAILCGTGIGIATAAEPLRDLVVNAQETTGRIRSLQGLDGLPLGADGGAIGIEDAPDVRRYWREAHVDAVRTYIWHTRLDTVDNPGSLFPRWDADPVQAANYNFTAADAAVRATRETGAEIMFTVASSIPQNNKPPADLAKWAIVVTHIVRHFDAGWARGFKHAVRNWEVGDEPDLNNFHFSGTPEQFYAMYAAAARAVKSVNPDLKIGGPGLAFPLNNQAPYREGFLAYVKREKLPFDFFSWKWFSDATEDPYDFYRVAAATTSSLQAAGLAGAQQFVSNWNFKAIPTARPDRLTMGVYESAALTYMQDTRIDRAFIFRGDAAMDNPKYKLGDFTTQMFNHDGTPMANAWGYIVMGHMQDTPERIAVTGGDDRGFAVLAGRSVGGDRVQVLITNYAIAVPYLQPTDKTSLDFDLPVNGARVPVSMSLPKRRVDAVSVNNGGYHLTLHGLSCAAGCTVERRRLDATHNLDLIDSTSSSGPTLELSAVLPAPAIELVLVRRNR